MICDICINIAPQKENDSNFISKEICRALNQKGHNIEAKDISFVCQKKSIDARHGKVKLVLKYKVYIGETPTEESVTFIPLWKNVCTEKKVLIIGSGPAGLFGALKLLQKGVKPIIIERGSQTSKRKRDIALISTKGEVDTDSNYCFGEGGAGTFSDGKLYTRSNKRGNISNILQTFAYFGADNSILTAAHPHIGTDRLPSIINKMRERIIVLGGEFYFDTRCIDFIVQNKNESKTVVGIKAENVQTKEQIQLFADAVLLATGHSSVDIYELLAKTSVESLEAKTFAVGVRVEHPRTLIDSIQYHKNVEKVKNLGAAEYRLVSQQVGRGVYSFCMCPGGFVVPSATAPKQIVVNGMSTASRNSKWSNAAIVVETLVQDIPYEFVQEAKRKNCPALAGLLWRQWLEQETFLHGDGQKAPAQRLVDFLSNTQSKELLPTSYTPGVVSSRLDKWLPEQVAKRLSLGFKDFEKSMKGFVSNNALLIASETRTSTPVRILRNKETGECTSLKNLYPAGEGSGYAGGIVSSAMDGENQCTKILKALGV